MKMNLTINKINELRTVVLPMAIDAQRPVPQPVGPAIMLDTNEKYAFSLDLKVRDITNRRHLNEAWDVFVAEREALCIKHSGEPALLPETHKNHRAWKAEVEELSRQTVEIKLYPYPLSGFQLEKNQTYPSANITLLGSYGLMKFDIELPEDEDEKPPVAKKVAPVKVVG